MLNQTPKPSDTLHPLRRILTWSALSVIAAATASCGDVRVIPCESLAVGDADAAVLVLGAGASAALQGTVDFMTQRPAQAFDAATLELPVESGVVVVASYDDAGEVTIVAERNLAPTGGDAVRSTGSAIRQANCLSSDLDALPVLVPVPDPSTSESSDPEDLPNLFRALQAADGLLDRTGAVHTALVVHGFSSTDNDGFKPARTDLSDEMRPGILQSLITAGVVPTIDRRVVFVDPAEGISSAIQASDITAFTELLCSEISPNCAVVTALN